jgi:hypothetical protein
MCLIFVGNYNMDDAARYEAAATLAPPTSES